MFLKKRWSLLLLKHRRQTAKFQFDEPKQVQAIVKNAPKTLKFAPITNLYQNFRLK